MTFYMFEDFVIEIFAPPMLSLYPALTFMAGGAFVYVRLLTSLLHDFVC